MVIGMYGGKFLPLHQGHVSAIIQASTMCDELYVILSYDEEYERKYFFQHSKIKYIPYQVRLRWIRQITKDLPHVKSYAIYEKIENGEYNWKQGAINILNLIGKPIDRVFSGENNYSPIFNELYPNAQHIIFDRNMIQISGTKIREEGVFKNWDYIPNVAKPFFTKKVVIVGTESCGKSTLVHNLATYYNTNYVNEYGRTLCEEVGGFEEVFTNDLFPQIAYRHKVNEFELIQQSNKVLFIDTESLVTQYYFNIFSNLDNDVLYEEMAKLHQYDLWLYLEPDVKWVDDGTRTMGDFETRTNNNNRLKAILNKNKIDYHSISGHYYERFNKAIELINHLLNK